MNVPQTTAITHPRSGGNSLVESSLEVPADAGRYRDALTTVLLRIPAGYEHRIACGRGWYPLIARLHKTLCDIDIDYVVYGVSNREGTLAYDAECQSDEPVVRKSFSEALAASQEQSRTVCDVV